MHDAGLQVSVSGASPVGNPSFCCAGAASGSGLSGCTGDDGATQVLQQAHLHEVRRVHYLEIKSRKQIKTICNFWLKEEIQTEIYIENTRNGKHSSHNKWDRNKQFLVKNLIFTDLHE